ncbi:hypothetical protein FJM67_16215 [Maribrevibacterium harenarium]|uniref:Uncharacterized protein n=1 Tax=Maribrevibacterium harenarium TaxID=2589817 RepID=A0A501WAC8_9GAMM|nr:hypothetical protein [Maribrevibacterium harenarium]TPE45762.1 hypothetical protein FJM67_16215 [Maribrevibacterium harenarium]
MSNKGVTQEDSQAVDREIAEIKEADIGLSIVMDDNPDIEKFVRENPDERRKIMARVQSAQYSGPFPLPTHLEHYERIYPGFTEKSFGQMEENAAREERIITTAQANEYNESKWNRNAAFGVVFLVLAAIVYLADRGHVAVPIALSGVCNCC